MRNIYILLFITGALLFASPPEWVDDPGAYTFVATISGAVILYDGVQLGEEGDLFAAFDDDGNVRGVSQPSQLIIPTFGPYEGTPVYEMTLRSDAEGDHITFKFYDASEDAVLDITEDYDFAINDIIGSLVEPVFYTTGFVTLSFANPTSPFNLMMGVCDGDNSTCSVDIKYDSNTAIAGFQFDVDGVTPLYLYNGDAEAAGFELFCGTTTCLGFSVTGATIPAGSGTLISLAFAESSENQTLEVSNVVISDSDGNAIPNSGLGRLPLLFTFHVSTQQAFYFFITATIDGAALAPEDWLGAFNGETCVGARNWDESLCGQGICDVPVMGNDGYVNTEGYIMNGDIPTFKIYDASENAYYDAVPSENIPWGNLEFNFIDNLAGGDYPVLGCTDINACNYNEDANSSDGSCYWPSGCDLVCGSTAVVDDCGVCDGDNSSCDIPEYFVYEQSTQQAYFFFFTATIDGAALAPEDWVGAFNGETCVGSRSWNLDYCNSEVCDVPVMGDDGFDWTAGYMEAGGTPSFKIYDASENTYYEAVASEDVQWQTTQLFMIDNLNVVPDCNGDLAGDAYIDSCGVCSGGNSGHEADSDIDCAGDCFGDALLDDCGTCDADPSNDCVDYTIALDGVDLISFHALPENTGVDSIFAGIIDYDPGVLGEGYSANYYNDLWMGTLMSIEPTDGYWVVIDGDADLAVVGIPTDPGTVFSLHQHTNLISYPFAGSSPVGETIPDSAQASIDAILGEGAAAMNTSDGWVGGLLNLSGTDGYWFITSEDVEFSYNPPVEGVARKASPIRSVPMEFAFRQSTQQAFYFVNNATIGGEQIDKEDLIIAYNGDVRVGSRYWYGETTDIPAMGTDGSDTYAGYCSAGDKISFKVLDASSGDLIDMVADGETIWNNNEFSIISLSDQIIPEAISFSSAYPNPFNPTTTLSFAIPIDSEVSLSIYNMQGREVSTLIESNMDAGSHSVVWDANSYASGVYFVKMVAGGQTNIQKLMLVK